MRQKVNVFQQMSARIRSKSLTSPLRVGTIRLILSDFVGQHRRRSTRMAEPTRVDVSRRTVLKGIAGAAGLISIPAIIAACSTTGSSAGAAGQRRCRRRRGGGSVATGTLTVGSYNSDPGPKKGMDGRRRGVHDRDGHRGQDQHRRPRQLPGPDLELPRRQAGHGLHVVLRVPHEVLRRPGLQRPDRRRVGQGQGQLHRGLRPRRSSATTRRSTGSRSTTTRGPSSTARASSRTRGTRSPRPGTSSTRCARRCRPTASPRSPSATRTAGPRWARSTSSTSGMNGYDFHVGLMAGTEKWTDAEGHRGLQEVGGVPAVPRQGLRRPDVAERGRHARPEEVGHVPARPVRLGAVRRDEGPGRPRRPRLLRLPDPGHAVRRREARSTPRSTRGRSPPSRPSSPPSRTPPRPTSSSGPRARPSPQVQERAGPIPTAKDADTSDLHATSRRRPSRSSAAPSGSPSSSTATPAPTSPGANGMQSFLQKFLANPTQDLAAYQKTIQDFWDGCPPLT